MRYFVLIILIFNISWGIEKHWVFFNDKGFNSHKDSIAALEIAKNSLSPRAFQRRLKILPVEHIVGFQDIPICQSYLRELEELGVEIVHKSKWLNAVSVRADKLTLQTVKEFQFVKSVIPAAVSSRSEPDTTDYREAGDQLRMLNVEYLHKVRVAGKDVLILINDTGFNPFHVALRNADLIAQWDFVDDDSFVYYRTGDLTSPSIARHGSFCWSLVGGYEENRFCGVAPDASFLLARTEDISSETPIEEDNWIAAIEWADSFGVDIMTSSLAYRLWYVPSSYNGDRALISIAADHAANIGITVFNSAGNSGPGYRTISAPGDADSIITVGACDYTGAVTNFSSRGPTADDRIKPEILAPGSYIYGVNGLSNSEYTRSSGTSMSCPLAAGVGVLLQSLRPSLLPLEIREALTMTGRHAIRPSNRHGWGLIDARSAAAYPIRDTSFVILTRGWNLFALPVDKVTPTRQIPTLFPIYWYNRTTYVGVDSLYPGYGYWVYSTTDTIFEVIGSRIDSLSINLQRGWNLIGGLSRKTFRWDFPFTYDIFPFIYNYEKGLFNVTTIIPPSCGVWLFSLKDTVLTLTH